MKIIVNVLIISIIGLALFGSFTNFIGNEETLKGFIYCGFCFSIVAVTFILIKILKEGAVYAERIRSIGISPLMLVISIVFIVPAFSVLASFKGLPVVLNYFFGAEGEIIVTVKSKPSRHYSKNCSGRVYLQNYNYFTNNRVCGIQESDWKKLKPGSKLILVGRKSVFGIQYGKYKS